MNDLFGNVVEKKNNLKEMFGENPFTVLDTKTGHWRNRKREWMKLGIKSEVGREDTKCFHTQSWAEEKSKDGDLGMESLPTDTSVFDPVLCELMYKWFCPEGGYILDPFAGGSVRGIVAHYLGYHYHGIDIREEQIRSNNEQARTILQENNYPIWIEGDSNKVLNTYFSDETFDMLFTCPPYADLEKYSDLDGDISNMKYDKFILAFEEIIHKACLKLKKGCYAVVVVGEVRGKDGNYYGFVPDTVKAFQRHGMALYNEAILLNALGSACFRASGNMKSHKLVKVHQNILVFKKM